MRTHTQTHTHTLCPHDCLSKGISLSNGWEGNKLAEKEDNLLSFSLPNDFLKSVSLPWQLMFHFFPLSLFIYLFLLCVNSAKILLKNLMALSLAQICCHMLPSPHFPFLIYSPAWPLGAIALSNCLDKNDTANYWQIIPSQKSSKTRKDLNERKRGEGREYCLDEWNTTNTPNRPEETGVYLSDSIKSSALWWTKLPVPRYALTAIICPWTLSQSQWFPPFCQLNIFSFLLCAWELKISSRPFRCVWMCVHECWWLVLKNYSGQKTEEEKSFLKETMFHGYPVQHLVISGQSIICLIFKKKWVCKIVHLNCPTNHQLPNYLMFYQSFVPLIICIIIRGTLKPYNLMLWDRSCQCTHLKLCWQQYFKHCN